MKSLSFYFLLLCLFLSGLSEKVSAQHPDTVYYFIRHAEKELEDPTEIDPELTAEGEKRAIEWAQLFSDKNIDFVFSTDFIRTQKTAQPIAEKHGLEISSYDYKQLYSSDFQEKTRGKNSVIVGHSNTTPRFINIILGKSIYDDIDENDYGKLYIITLSGDDITHIVKNIN